MEEKYKIILNMILNYYSINDIEHLNKNKERLYIVLLLLNKYGVLENKEYMKGSFICNLTNVRLKLKKAEEKLLINREFRKKYFELEQLIKEII
ncbi:MAG: hypothetical protein ACRC7N_18600 [Clostridium sp.]